MVIQEIQGWNAFEEKYKPQKNHFSTTDMHDVTMYETYGEELEYIKSVDNNRLWTWIQGDMSDLIVPGYCIVNRLGYYVTEIPWTDEDEYVLLSVELECECYNEDGYENGEYGSEDCNSCEGYGYVTEYVGD